jgi:hypothetical protein
MLLLESVESIGVRLVSLRSYVEDYNGSGLPYVGRIFLARHDDVHFDEETLAAAFYQYAVDLLGYPYDRDEIVSIATRIAGSRFGRPEHEANPEDRAFICSEYVAHCFAQIGLVIPYDRRGFIAPSDFAACPSIKILWEIAL